MLIRSHDGDRNGHLDGLEVYRSVEHGMIKLLDEIEHSNTGPDQKEGRKRAVYHRLVSE